MDPSGAAVKPPPLRRLPPAGRRRGDADRGPATRRSGCSSAQGFAATTVPAIARAAGVSAELLYKAFGGKAGLVRAIQHRALEGAGPVPAPDRSDALAAVAPDARSLLAAVGAAVDRGRPPGRAGAAPRPVRRRDRPGARPLLEEMSGQRLARMAVNAARLAALPGVRRGLPVERIRDVLWAATAPELFDLLVLQRGWTVEEYRDHLFRGLCAQLLEP